MSTRKSIILWLLVSPFLVLFVFSIIWDPNWLRGKAEPHLEDIEGHQVDFANLEHSLYDPGYLEVQDISIKGEFINGSLGTLILDASIKDALNKNIIIREITLKDTDLEIHMQAMQQYQEDQTEEDEQDVAVTTDTESDGIPVNKIYIEKLALENVKVRDISELRQFIVSGLSLTLRELNIVENAEFVIGNPGNPVSLALGVDQLQIMSSPVAQVVGRVVATEDNISLDKFDLSTPASKLQLNGLIRNPKADAELQLVLQDSKIVLDEFAALLTQLPIDAKGTLDMNGEVYTKGPLSEPDALMNSLASNLNLVLDTGTSQLDIAGELRTEVIPPVEEGAGTVDNLDKPEETQSVQTHQANIKLQINDSHINLAELDPLLTGTPVHPSGDVTLSGLINTSGELQDINSMLGQLSGDIQLAMDGGKLQGIDINKIVSGFKESKETDLVDVGSFLLTGPIGILASNLVDLGAGAAQFEGETILPQLRVKGHMENGSINLHNTALATDKYRLAFDGAVNPAKGAFEDFTFAILDQNGCADIKQTLNGEFTQPTSAVAKSLLDSALAPVTGLINSVKNKAIECTPFYEGEVLQPAE